MAETLKCRKATAPVSRTEPTVICTLNDVMRRVLFDSWIFLGLGRDMITLYDVSDYVEKIKRCVLLKRLTKT